MKKGKFLKAMAIAGTCLCAPLLLTGCRGDNENKTDFRIHDGYLQTTTDGTSWNNIIELDKKYIISYDYGIANDFFKSSPESVEINSGDWITLLPEIKDVYKNSFLGWFIQGTDKKISNYDYIAGNVTLDARFDFKTGPSGLYQNCKFVASWQSLIDEGDIVVEEDEIILGLVQGDLKIDASVTKIGEEAFKFNTGLEGVLIPSNVNIINKDAFAYCHNLSKLQIEDGLQIIADDAFRNCDKLTSLIIPLSVNIIGEGAFYRCDNLNSITLKEFNNRLWKVYYRGETVSQDALALTNHKLISYFIKGYEFKLVIEENGLDYVIINSSNNKDIFAMITRLSDITITETEIPVNPLQSTIKTETIDNFAFANCENLIKVVIPNSISSIGDYVFYGCEKLTEIIFKGTQEEWEMIEIGELNQNLQDGSITIKFEPIVNE